ncbi:MAG: hypothetical protein BHV68_02835 [Bacteroidales bacterium 43_8]|nr:MAG: hypothetical protein BHV68_02835 [Bacteroidales bacterium 43_8]
MATVNNPSLQGFSGKIDGHVAYTVGKKTYLRKLAISISNPRTEKQTAQRVKLTAAQTMYRAIRGSLLEKVHAIAAKEEERRSGYHGFLHANMNICSLQLPFSMKATRCTPEELELAWLDNSSTVTAHPSDQLLVAAIFDNEPYQPEMLETNVFCRQNGQASVLLPEGEWGTAHLYCFFSAENRERFSPCMYFTVSKL